MTNIINDPLTYAIVFHDGTTRLISVHQYTRILKILGKKKNILLDKSVYSLSSIARIVPLEEYYEEYPEEHPARYDQPTILKRPIYQKREALTKMLEGLQGYINSRVGKIKPEVLELRAKMQAKLNDPQITQIALSEFPVADKF